MFGAFGIGHWEMLILGMCCLGGGLVTALAVGVALAAGGGKKRD